MRVTTLPAELQRERGRRIRVEESHWTIAGTLGEATLEEDENLLLGRRG
jgi:hypothetical protein